MVGGVQESVERLPDDNPMYSGWGNSGWKALGYSIDPERPDETFAPLRLVKTSTVKARKILLPGSRWRGDFMEVAESMPENSFVAPDGVTIIPDTYDLSRSMSLFAVAPGQSAPAYVANENNKSTLRFAVGVDGRLSGGTEFAPHGQYSSTVDAAGNVYIADGEIFVYSAGGELLRRIQLPERPISIVIGGAGMDKLFVTTTKSLYAVNL